MASENDDRPDINESIASAVTVLTRHAREITAGSYENVDEIFRLTDGTTQAPEITELAESFGMMSVKVEAREFELEQTIAELKAKKADLEKSIRAREEFGRIFIVFALVIGLYTFLVGVMNMPAFSRAFGGKLTSWAGVIFSVIMVVMAVILLRRSGLPLGSFGLNLNNAGKAVRESLLASAAVLGLAVLFKAWARAHLPAFRGRTILNPAGVDVFFWLYLVVAPVQEFCARGVFQSSVERTMSGPHRGFWAVVTASVMFGAFHTFYSVPLALTALAGSLLWGWLYQRHGTLLGVALSHFLIGNGLSVIDVGLFFIS